MKRISSRYTFFNKRVFPLIWFGFLAVIIFASMLGKKAGGNAALPFLIFPIFMGIFGYFLMKKLVFDLADEVFDAGDSLVVRFGNDEERIPLANIVNLSYSYISNPQRVTLTLRNPGRFGKEVTFSPPLRFVPFASSPIIAELIERVDAARRG